jgi:transcriptional regulator with XRE-family HTH domain
MPSRTPQPNEAFGQHLRALRRTHKLTHEQLAERADLGVNIVGRLERAVISPGLVSILKLATALDTTASKLLEVFSPEMIRQMKIMPPRAAKSRR